MPPKSIPNSEHNCSLGCKVGETGFCDEHKLAVDQLSRLKDIPSMVNRMYGVISLIGTLFVLLIGLVFNMHFEYKKSIESYSTKIDTISNQIAKMELDNNKAISSVSSEILKINMTLEQLIRNHSNNSNDQNNQPKKR